MLDPSDAVLLRYLTGDCSVDEIQQIRQWATRDAAHQERLNELRLLWATERPMPTWDVSGTWARLQQAIEPPTMRPVLFSTTLAHRSPSRRGFPRRVAIGLAALAAASLLVVGAELQRRRAFPWSNDGVSVTSDAVREYVTARGQRLSLRLSDGTKLVLAPESRLRISSGFGRRAREVLLEGEALFDVVHDVDRPFRVIARYATAEDLGTRFGVRAYAEDSAVVVAVAEGAVALRSTATLGSQLQASTAPRLQLLAGDRGTLSASGSVTKTKDPNVDDDLSWASGRLTVKALPLRDVIARLGRWYDVDIRLATPALAERRVTATFADESAEAAVAFLATFLDLRMTHSNDRYTLYAN